MAELKIEKTCSSCEIKKLLTEFYKNKSRSDGLAHACKECDKALKKDFNLNNKKTISERNRKQYLTNIDARKLYSKDYFHKNKATITPKMREYYYENQNKLLDHANKYRSKNKKNIALTSKKWRELNKDHIRLNNIKRKEIIKNAMPKWADPDAIKMFYRIARFLRDKLGEDYHVDHIVPLHGDNVCGFHCESNLQILSAEENLAKGNKYYD